MAGVAPLARDALAALGIVPAATGHREMVEALVDAIVARVGSGAYRGPPWRDVASIEYEIDEEGNGGVADVAHAWPADMEAIDHLCALAFAVGIWPGSDRAKWVLEEMEWRPVYDLLLCEAVDGEHALRSATIRRARQ